MKIYAKNTILQKNNVSYHAFIWNRISGIYVIKSGQHCQRKDWKKYKDLEIQQYIKHYLKYLHIFYQMNLIKEISSSRQHASTIKDFVGYLQLHILFQVKLEPEQACAAHVTACNFVFFKHYTAHYNLLLSILYSLSQDIPYLFMSIFLCPCYKYTLYI